MPVVSKQEIILKDKTHFTRIVKYVKPRGYKSGSPYFEINLPDRIANVQKDKTKSVTANTEGEVLKKFQSVVDEYFTHESKVTKIIVMKIKAGIIDDACWNDKLKYNELKFSWGVYTKTAVANEADYKFENIGRRCIDHWDEKNINKKKELKSVIWTAERQKWFEEVESSFNKMIEKIDHFMTEMDETKLTKAIDTGKAFLLTSNTVKK